ncbi:MFS general substrate transporter [Sporormia fimetaria CBS 119925]|uniref:MFS general substrate transporter n=1 Tax=Sporormia fimetaria CBS 119925 TaxID=1340428 RepID=A0A6A6VG51_9PLEO|nr:MFS general substrate transporter [Sporormia fimetaria CBS 119925]
MTERRLPVKQLVILSICRFAEPIALTSVFPYLPEMIESFGIPENDIARWAGLTSAIFSICQGFTGIPWGAASDRFGRKSIILIGLINTMAMTLLWGFSTSLPMAMTARALQGLGSGNVGILRTTVAELCPWKELQPRAFSIMPLVFSIGAIIGPTLGGALSNPLRVDPRKPRGNSFFEKYPYSLPNMAAAGFFCIGIVTGWLFLKETLETRKNDRDYGLIIGAQITAAFRKTFKITSPKKKNPEREPLLHRKSASDEEATDSGAAVSGQPQEPVRMRDILTFQTSLNLVVYTFLALYTLAYDQLLPVFMHHPPQSIDDSHVSLPLKFAGGFGIGSRRIGVIFTVFSVTSMLCQFFVFPPLARRIGVLHCLRAAFFIFPAVFFVTPFVSLLPSQAAKEAAIVFLLVIRGFAGTIAWPTITILLTNSAGSLRVLGTLNGLATSVSAVGRAAGPAIGGSLFTFGVKHGYVIVPFWTLSAIALLGSIFTWWLVEGKGFGDDPDPNEEDVVIVSASASSASSVIEGTRADDEEDERAMMTEPDYGEPTNLLSYTSTRSSAAVASDDELDMTVDEVQHHWRDSVGSAGVGGSHSYQRHGKKVRRKSSVPIGMGVGFRRLSTNLGSTGLGVGGQSWGG